MLCKMTSCFLTVWKHVHANIGPQLCTGLSIFSVHRIIPSFLIVVFSSGHQTFFRRGSNEIADIYTCLIELRIVVSFLCGTIYSTFEAFSFQISQRITKPSSFCCSKSFTKKRVYSKNYDSLLKRLSRTLVVVSASASEPHEDDFELVSFSSAPNSWQDTHKHIHMYQNVCACTCI